MEVRRRSISSEYEFRERRTADRKRRGALPLAMVLSFNDKDVHPDCPNVSNPYHKCGRHCLDKIPTGQNFLDAIRSGGDQEWDKKSEKTGVNPNCPYASNPYHKCAEYCSGKLLEKPQDAGKDKPGVNPKKEVFTTEKEVKPECIYASNPYHVCAEYCVPIVPEKDQPRQSTRLKGSREGEKVLIARHASNPNQECAESCLQIATDRNVADRVKHKGAPKKTNKGSVHLIRNASSHNKVTEYFFEDAPKKEEDMQSKKENEIDHTTQLELSCLCKNASKADLVCDEYCFQSVPEREQYGQVIKLESSKEGENAMSNNIESTAAKPKEESEIIVTVEQVVNIEYKNASNPSDARPEYCSESVPEREQHEQIIRLKSMKEGDKFLNNRHSTGFDPCCKLASNPHHECTEFCFKNTPDRNLAEEAITKSMEKEVAVVPLERVNLQCKLASNPYHVCAEYCFQNVSNGHHPERSMMISKEKKKVVLSPQVVNLECKYSSNPYHVCAEYCFKNVLERDPPRQTIKKLKEEDAAVLPSERQVSPECKFASNPYHVCAEYCVKNALEGEQQGQVMKLKSLKELKGLVNNKKITSGHPQCEYSSNPYHQCAENCFNKNVPASKIPDRVVKRIERKKEKSYSPRRDDNPKYKNASNSFHRCPDYCSEETSPTNEVVEGSTATIKKKKRNSSKGNKRNHPIVEKISLNSRYMEASKPGQNYVESSEQIILHDGTEKSSMDSKYAGAFNPTNHNFNLNNGISMYMQYETKDLQSDIRNPKEPNDVPPLHIDASDLFNEWANYCSQTKVAEDEIVKQEKKVGIGELTTRNGKANSLLKDYDAANLEKVQATVGIPRSSLPILLLFLLGFLLALLHWARVIHSLVISSEKHEEPERMKHERHLDPKCKKVSDPCHKFSHYRFPGVDDEIQ